MCSYGLSLCVVVFVFGLWTIDCSKDGCPSIVLRSPHFAKVHNGTCYLFVDRERYWQDARDSCLRMGGEMLSIENYQTMTFIRTVLNSRELGWSKRGVWLWARFSGGAWRWSSGKKLGYANWASGEPSKLLGIFSVEDCALMRNRDDWRWHDYICGTMKYHFNYICQFPLQNPTTTTTTTTAISITPIATVVKQGHFSKKGHFVDGKDSQLDIYESLQQDMGQEPGAVDQPQSGVPLHPGHKKEQGVVQNYPYDSRHPASSDRGYNEVHSTSQVLNNGNLTILIIILVTGGIILLILLLIFLILRKRYNYKKAMGQPATVHFENRNYNHAHNSNSSGHHAATMPLPPPPAPHSFHRVPLPPSVPSRPMVPRRPLVSELPPRPAEAVPSAPHLSAPYVPHSRPASDLYLTPMEIGGGVGFHGGDIYEEIAASTLAQASNLSSSPAQSLDMVDGSRAGGRRYPLQHEDSATIPLISASGCPWNRSDDSLNEATMSTSLTMKTSSIHNDYVDMNGTPVVPARNYRQEEAGTSKADEGKLPGSDGNVSALDSDPKSEMSVEGDSDRAVTLQGDDKQPVHYSNLMTASQERCENLYAQLH